MDILVDQLKDPLEQTTRKVRKNLLLTSIIGILVVKMELVPKKVTALGIEFSQSDQDALLVIVGLVTFYFMVNFLTYLITEFASWKLAIASDDNRFDKLPQHIKEDNSLRIHEKRKYMEESRHFFYTLQRKGKALLIARICIEVLVPIFFAFYSMYLTL